MNERQDELTVLEVSGDRRTMGRQSGEARRGEIRQHVELLRSKADLPAWRGRLGRFLAPIERHAPGALDEMTGLAEGAGIHVEDIYLLNLPGYADALHIDEGCTNIAFLSGPDGPLLGKNNDALAEGPFRPTCVQLARPGGGPAMVTIPFAGMLHIPMAMNAEGLAIGSSSVGSVFQQSDDFVPIRLWQYEGMLSCRTAGEFVHHMTSIPLRGKGFSLAVVDRHGTGCSLECPCPLVQLRRPGVGENWVSCVNKYQLSPLADADRRSPAAKANAQARLKLLDDELAARSNPGVNDMQTLLRHHGSPALCRHGGDDDVTEWSAIAVTADRRLLYANGNPCEAQYQSIDL